MALLSTGIAAIVGSFAAYFGGWFERIALWVTDLLLVIPSFLLIAVITTGQAKGANAWLLLVVLLAAFGWMLSARVVRSLTHVDQGARVRPGRASSWACRRPSRSSGTSCRTSPRC